MKKITLKLASVTLALVMLMSVMPFSIFAADDTNSASESEASVTTKTYDFSDSSQLDDFYSYYWSKNENGQIRDTNVTDSYKLENGILTRTRDYHTWNGGWLDHITALTFKDVEFKNFDLSFEMQYNVGDNGCAKFFYVGMREILPGQPGQAVGPDCWWGSKDSNGNTTNNIYINLYGKATMNSGSEDAVAGVENTYGKMCKYRVRAVGTTVSVWAFDTTGEPDYTFNEADGIIDRTGTLSLCFLDTQGAIDNISITNLDDEGNEAEFPVASTKYLKKNMAAKNSASAYHRDFMTETWENVDGEGVYTVYPDMNSAAYAYDDWNLLTSDLGHVHGYSADNMAALTLNDPSLRNFEATVTMRFLNSGLPCCGNFAINMREQEPGKLFRTAWNDTDAWPPIATMNDGTHTVALATSAESTEVNVWNTTHTTVATRTAEDFSTLHTYKVKLVGDTLYTWVDGVQAETVSGLALEDEGYLSFISSNQRVVIGEISVTWLDEEGNPAEWGTEPKTVDSTREWFGEGNSMDLSEFRSSYWDSDNGYVSTVPAIIGNSDAAWKADTFWKNTGWYTLEPLYDNRYGDTTFTDGSWADNMVALTLNDNSFRNFEVEVSVTGYTGHFNPIMISAREKNPGQPVAALGSWSYGIQSDLTENVVLKYFVNDSNATITSGSNVAEIAGIVTGDYEYKTNNLKLRVVGDTATVWVNDSNQGTLQLSENCEESGYISIIFANVAGAINNLKITRLGEDGSPIDFNTGKQLFIKSVEDFAKIGKNVAYPADGNYWLTNDIVIDESNPWTSVAEFSGSLNGDGHTIKGLTNALIHTTTGDATVSNLIIKDINSSNTSDYDFKGAVIRHVKGTATIENIAVTGYIANNLGGAFVGCVDNDCKLTINNCSFIGTMLMSYMGGFIGKCSGTQIINNSYSEFTVEWSEMAWNYAVDDAPITANNSYYKKNTGSIDTNYSAAKTLETLGLPSEYWVHNGKIPQLKITGAENFIAGDANLDKTVDLKDLVAMKKYIAQISSNNFSVVASNMDGVVTADGTAVVNATDLTIFRKNLLGGNTNNYKTYDVNLTGAKALYLGDSIAHGANDTVTGAAVANTPNDVPSNLAWCGRVSKEYGMTGTNVAMSGWALASGHGMKRIVDEFNMVEDVSAYDYVILHGGVNDVWHSKHTADSGCAVALGAITAEGTTEFDNTTLYGALEEYVTTAISLAPNAKIGYIINPDISSTINAPAEKNVISYADMVTAIKAVCDKYKISYLDFSSDEEFINKFEKSLHLVDGVHPNSAGYDVIADYVGEWMTTL